MGVLVSEFGVDSREPVVSVILPVRNQADHIDRVVRLHRQMLSENLPVPFEFVLVENGSTDDSLEGCRKLEREITAVKALRSETVGWGAAIRLGIDRSRGEIICYASSARVDSRVLLDCIKLALEEPGAVIQAVRLGHDNALRSLASKLYQWQSRILFGIRSQDINGNPKVFSRKLAPLCKLTEKGFMVDLEFCLKCKELGYRVIEVPVNRGRRHGGKSMTGFGLGSRLYIEAFKLWLSRRLVPASHSKPWT